MPSRNELTYRHSKNGDEYDWTSRWRHAYGWKSGTGAYIKRRISKRARRMARREIDG